MNNVCELWTPGLPCWEQGALSAKDVRCSLQVLSAGAQKQKKIQQRQFTGGVEIHTSVKWKWQSVSASIREHYQKNKNKSATLDCKEQHGVNSTKRENNTNCLPVIN